MSHCEVIVKTCEHMSSSVCGLLMVHIVILNGLLLRLNSTVGAKPKKVIRTILTALEDTNISPQALGPLAL